MTAEIPFTDSYAAATVLYRPDPAVLEELLQPLADSGVATFIFVNGEISPDAEALIHRLQGAQVAGSPVNLGLGAGLNAVMAAAKAAGVSHVVLFDQDSVPSPGLIGDLASRFADVSQSSEHRLAALGPVLVAPAGESYLEPWYARRRGVIGNEAVPVSFLPTSGTMIAMAAFDAIGPFRQDYFIDGIDVEWCFRAWSKDYCCALATDLTMPHRWGEAKPGERGKPQILRQSPLRSYYYLRNATSGLRLAHVPWAWRLRTMLRLAAQSALLLTDSRFSGAACDLVRRALQDGWSGRLGPAPAEILSLRSLRGQSATTI